MSLLTIIMPVYNAQDTLPAALNGVLNQTYKNLEILLVNDGSTDGIGQLLKRMSEQDERIQVITQKHAGSASARNAALQLATGSFVYFADADDIMAPEAARIMVERMVNPGTDLLTFGYREINRRTGAVKEVTAPEGRFSGEQVRSDYTKWTADSPCKVLGSCWNKCFRMDLIKEYGVVFPDLKRNEEEVFIMRYIEHVQDIYNIPNMLYDFYPIGLRQAWERLPDNFCEEVDKFRKERLAYARKWYCDTPKTREFIAREYWGKMILGLRLCFNPDPKKKKKYGEFARRSKILMRGLDSIGNVPASITGSNIYKLLKKGITPVAWLLIKRSSRR
ncbi:MAG: glycosyltransferase family 2 protein [Lachnospiraceae bacterium]|nr:glycosyltransferase family 2 protein [Lachnospiraceae bacterium]